MKVKDVIEVVYNKLWFRHRIALFDSVEEVKDILKNLWENKLIELECGDHTAPSDTNPDISLDCSIKVNVDKCRNVIAKIEEYYRSRNSLLSIAFNALNEELLSKT